ncbi:PdaC/SigV domain-containing protein [Peribacillus sp. JNUCC 23]
MDKDLEKLKDRYMIPIPEELNDVINRALQTPGKKKKVAYKWSIGIVAAAILLMTTVNLSPSAANAMSDIPIIGKVIDVITLQERKEEKDNHASVDIKVPEIPGLDNSGLEASLNEKYIEESKQLYQEFTNTLAELKEGENTNMAVTSGYEVLTDNDTIFSIRCYNVITQASSSTEMQFDTIDKKIKSYSL